MILLFIYHYVVPAENRTAEKALKYLDVSVTLEDAIITKFTNSLSNDELKR